MVPCPKQLDFRPDIYGNEYHGILTRAEATQALSTEEDGSYLVRASAQRPGEYSLSFMYHKPRHFLLYHNDTGFFVGDGSFDTIEELVADGLISLYMEEHKVEQYINRQIFKRKSCKKNSRLKHIASACRALAKYTDNQSIDTIYSEPYNSKRHAPTGNEEFNAEAVYVTLVPPGDASTSAPSPKIKPPIPPRTSSLSQSMRRPKPAVPPRRSPADDFESFEPVYDTVHVSVNESDYEHYYSIVQDDDQPIYSVPDGETDEDDDDLEYFTPTDDDEGTPPPLPPRTEDVYEAVQNSKTLTKRRVQRESNFTNSPFKYEKRHSFKLSSFKGPTWCDHCKNFLWGLKRQGHKCEDCGSCVHKQCLAEMEHDCQPSRKYINGVYGIDLVTILKLQQMKIPNVIRECVSQVESRGMDSLGIYRMSGKQEEISTIKDSFNSGHDPKLNNVQDINAITGAMKSFLRLLPTPLINGESYTHLMEEARSIEQNSDRSNEIVANFRKHVENLSLAHYNVLRYVMKHLHRVAEQHDTNRMTADNLAVIFAPTLMRSENDMFAFADLSQQRKLVEFLIINYHDIF
ncbi:N-chimaerin-like isoform X2 [Dysidea avara]